MWYRLGKDDFDRTSELMNSPTVGASEWGVCQEYVLQELPQAAGEGNRSYQLVPKYPFSPDQRDKWRMYKPLEDVPDLFLKFAKLYEHDGSIEPIIEWVHRYGSLEKGHRQGYGKPQEIENFSWNVSMAAGILALYEAVLNGDRKKARSLILEEFCQVSLHWHRLFRSPPEGIDLRSLADVPRDVAVALISETVEQDHNGDYLEYALWSIVSVVDARVRYSCQPNLYLGRGHHRNDPSKVKASWSFRSLQAAMYLQMYWLIAAAGDVTRCRYCGGIISLASPQAGARKTRQDKKFCNDACRQRQHYHTKTKPRRQSKSGN